jgi:hypothetical protein
VPDRRQHSAGDTERRLTYGQGMDRLARL